MTKAFAEITYTPSVKAAQQRYGSPPRPRALEAGAAKQNELGESESEFIGARDGFYQATVSETGWPYVQFRGGPVGFLKVLDSRRIGFADFRGNVQYVSVGNLDADDRVALILMDYANRQRLKILGRASVIDRRDDPELVASLADPKYEARVERAIVIAVEAYDWNCPQHITPRFTQTEVRAAMEPLLSELEELREIVKTMRGGDK
ncbi:MAG: pyridoxamine 5'-phosphate oxidase family protein [Dokdonella sp.]|uniref:pyridoxamine 5'-phosphate oxidase family protein n=1 Tax=Dokdonella sp. TaxID=2291710 RepID=UPI0032633E4D